MPSRSVGSARVQPLAVDEDRAAADDVAVLRHQGGDGVDLLGGAVDLGLDAEHGRPEAIEVQGLQHGQVQALDIQADQIGARSKCSAKTSSIGNSGSFTTASIAFGPCRCACSFENVLSCGVLRMT